MKLYNYLQATYMEYTCMENDSLNPVAEKQLNKKNNKIKKITSI